MKTFTRRDLPKCLRSKTRLSSLTFEGSKHWIWTGCLVESGRGRWLRPKAYGQVRWNGRRWRAHRLVYTLLVAPVPDYLVVDHRCRVTQCVNPAHLEAVTLSVNAVRAVRG